MTTHAMTPFSIVIPVRNEAGNLPALLVELEPVLHRRDWVEAIVVDDHSTDQTPDILRRHQARLPWLKTVRMPQPGGQSAALYVGIRRASSPVIVTMDGDGQNDPADIDQLVDVLRLASRQNPCCLVTGYRARRRDCQWRRLCSAVANSIRGRLLGDRIPDSGCGLKAFPRDMFLSLPPFHHMHRFLPALVCQRGGIVVSVGVNHRPRAHGRSHYGTLDRLWAGFFDLFGVLWLGRRAISFTLTEEDDHA